MRVSAAVRKIIANYTLSWRQRAECSLAIRQKVLGPEHPDTAPSLNGLAILLSDPGDPRRYSATL